MTTHTTMDEIIEKNLAKLADRPEFDGFTTAGIINALVLNYLGVVNQRAEVIKLATQTDDDLTRFARVKVNHGDHLLFKYEMDDSGKYRVTDVENLGPEV